METETQSSEQFNPNIPSAYVLINTKPGYSLEVGEKIAEHKKPGHKWDDQECKCEEEGVKVKEIYLVSGEYDLIAAVEGDTVKSILEFVVNKIQNIHASPDQIVTRTSTAFRSDWIP